MEFSELVKNLILVLLGGLVTFVVTYSVNRIQAKKPKLFWRLLPSITLKSDNLSAINVSVTNEGTKQATDVNVDVKLPEASVIESHEINLNEEAVRFAIDSESTESTLRVHFPSFQVGLDCIVSILVRNADPDDVKISLAGKESIGLNKGDNEDEKNKKFEKIYRYVFLYGAGVFGVIYVMVTIYLLILALGFSNFQHSMDAASIYVELGKPEPAIVLYEELLHDSIYPKSERFYYKIAVAYAISGDSLRTLEYLRLAVEENPEILDIANLDNTFNSIRSHAELDDFLSSGVR